MDLETFRNLVKKYCRDAGKSQKSLASAVGIHHSVLSNKLNGTKSASLALYEIKSLIKTLVEWRAVNGKDDVVQLLSLVDLPPSCFTPQEWDTPPLKDLEQMVLPVLPARPQPPKIAQSQPTDPTPTPVKISSVAVAEAPSAPAPATEPAEPAPLHNLPAQLTPLVGRNTEVSTITGFLQRADVRLLTLSGPGGVGKTRLALRTATNLISDFEDGVWFVPLATIAEPGLLVPTIATYLSVKETGREPLLQTLQTYLKPRQALLILDNFEQVAEYADIISQLLENAPRLKVLVTSRIRLQLYGEYIFDVPPLDLPAPSNYTRLTPEQLQELTHNEAIALFLQRTRAVQHDFRLNQENARSVIEICQQLNGLPLALELAAARLRVFTPAQLLEQFATVSPARTSLNLTWLSGGGRNLPLRQQTIHGSLDWSYHLLTPAEQRLLRQLSVFVGGFTAEAVLEICFNADTSRLSLSESLQALLDHSLIRLSNLTTTNETRYDMLLVVREYALEKLKETEETDQIRQKHTDYYFKLALKFKPDSTAVQARSSFAPIEKERSNLRASLDWLWEKRNTSQLVQLIRALWQFWFQNNYYDEASYWVDLVLDHSQDLAKLDRAQLLSLRGAIYWLRGNPMATQACDEECLAIHEELGNQREIARTLGNMALTAKNQRKLEHSAQMYERAITIYRQINNEGQFNVVDTFAHTIAGLGLTFMEMGKYDQAEELLRESLSILKENNAQYEVAGMLLNLGNVAIRRHEYAKAKDLYSQSLALFQESGIQRGVAMAQRNLAFVAVQEGDYIAAENLGRPSLAARYQVGDIVGIASSLEIMASVAVAYRQYDKAVQMFAAIDTLRTTSKVPRTPFDELVYIAEIDKLRNFLGQVQFARLWAAGSQQPIGQIVEATLES